jgi:hypothetical protein
MNNLFSNNSISVLDNLNFTIHATTLETTLNNTNNCIILFSADPNSKKYKQYLKNISNIAPSIINTYFYVCTNLDVMKTLKLESMSLILFKNGKLNSIYDDILEFNNILTFCLS